MRSIEWYKYHSERMSQDIMNVTWIDSLRLRARAGRIKKGWAACSRTGIAFLDTPQATLRVRVAGERKPGWPTVVMVCDPPNVVEHFDGLCDLIRPHGRLIVFEPPGFGFSCPERSFRFTFNEYLACIEHLLRSFDEGPYVLAFTCVWAHIALQIAARDPALVAKLLLWQCPSWQQQVAWARGVDTNQMLSRPIVGQLTMARSPEKIGLSWYKFAMAKNRYPDFMPTLMQALQQGGFCCLGSLWQQWFYEGYVPPPVHVQQPTLVSWGMADGTHARSDPRSLADQIAQVTWHRFEHAGHSPELESSREYFELLRGWIEASPGTQEPAVAPSTPWIRQLAEAPSSERGAMLEALVVGEFRARLLMEDSEVLPPDQSLFALGLTSLGAVESQQRLEATFGRRVDSSSLYNHPTVDYLLTHLRTEVLADLFVRAPTPQGAAMGPVDQAGRADQGAATEVIDPAQAWTTAPGAERSSTRDLVNDLLEKLYES